jgi:hypothetical protein
VKLSLPLNSAFFAATIFLSCSLPSLAVGDDAVHVVVLDPDFDASLLAKPGEKVKIETEADLSDAKSSLPGSKERDKILADAQLLSYVTQWDELDRDLLLLRARDFSADRLSRKYPQLPAQGLKALRQSVGGLAKRAK